jgi:hypothetical protein
MYGLAAPVLYSDNQTISLQEPTGKEENDKQLSKHMIQNDDGKTILL